MASSLHADDPALARVLAQVPLRSTTSARWVGVALSDVDALLDDHCQCELKAATNALALVGRHPDRDELVRAMASLAKEEMHHYRIVRRVLLERGGRVHRPVANPYVKGLSAHRLGGEHALLDDLLVAALVEARSCERFVALAHGLRAGRGAEDWEGREALASLYARLARSESGHARLFLDLSRRYFGPSLVGRELERRLDLEAAVLAELPPTPRMHGGMG